jgi:hypothetical protein
MNIFERKVYRRILGSVYENEKETWRILTNKEIYARVKKPTIIETVRLNRLCWFGHVQRMEGNRIPKRVLYRVSQEECARLREGVPYVKLYRYNPKHLYPKLNGHEDNGQRNVWASGVSTYCTPTVTSYLSNAPARRRNIVMQ